MLPRSLTRWSLNVHSSSEIAFFCRSDAPFTHSSISSRAPDRSSPPCDLRKARNQTLGPKPWSGSGTFWNSWLVERRQNSFHACSPGPLSARKCCDLL